MARLRPVASASSTTRLSPTTHPDSRRSRISVAPRIGRRLNWRRRFPAPRSRRPRRPTPKPRPLSWFTQHRFGVQNVHMACNLLLLRGNIGKPGAGPCPVRGHSNVQGQRTVGITEKPELAPLDKLAEQFGFEPPREKGRNTVEACEGILSGEVRGFVSLGGNFVRAIPDTDRMEEAWRRLRLSVQIATKLNRSHLVPGEVTYLLPCLSRIERDVQASGPQTVTMEDSTSVIHPSFGEVEPSSKDLLSETTIVAELAKATLAPNPKLDWTAWTANYSKVRDAIAESYPQWFGDFNAKLGKPGGFYRANKARKRDFSEPKPAARYSSRPRNSPRRALPTNPACFV
jgi:anaerobic selenocysteine-containing dehydrogenase